MLLISSNRKGCCLAIEQAEGSTSLSDFTPKPNTTYALVFGHEVKGVSQEIMSTSNQVLEIPQEGTKHSSMFQ